MSDHDTLDGKLPARFFCPECGTGDHLNAAEGQPCAYCADGRTADRVRLMLAPAQMKGSDD